MIDVTESRCGACACGVEPLAHPRYSFGMLLEPRHLAMEHRYGAMRMNAHDIRLHDFGTVCGLRVEPHPSPACVNTYAILRPGIALDCCGREIVVPEDLYVPLHDGATSGGCGAPLATQASPAVQTTALRATSSTTISTERVAQTAGESLVVLAPPPLYVYLRYRECDTDPIPTYVRACGCCPGECEHGTCVPSVTREGYEVSVSTKAPAAWRNPVSAAFCAWLDAQIKGPAASPATLAVSDRTLDRAICEVVTEPCVDVCARAGDALLLATVRFEANGTLRTIDNCTDRRVVISTAALAGAVACLAHAVAKCCKNKAYLALTAVVDRAEVNLEQPPENRQLTYTVGVTNADAGEESDPFDVELALPAGTTFGQAMLVVDGTTMPPPSAAAGAVVASVAALAAGKTATMTVTATFDPAAHKPGDALVATASIPAYDGDHAGPVSVTTTFIDVHVPGPRVIVKGLPTSMTAAEFSAMMRAPGLALPFTSAIDPATAVAGTSVFLETVRDGVVTDASGLKLTWSNADTQLNLTLAPKLLSQITTALTERLSGAAAQTPYTVRVRLLGGPDGWSPTPGPALVDPSGLRLDGAPASGGTTTGESGNGVQGGDFEWTIAITVPALVDGPHVAYAKLPDTLTVARALSTFQAGLHVSFDEAMNESEPADGAAPSGSVKLMLQGPAGPVPVAITTQWLSAAELVIRATDALRLALDALNGQAGTLTLTLAGGAKGVGATSGVLTSATGHALDGSPARGTGALQTAGKSGDGQQGGDFVWPITISATPAATSSAPPSATS